MTMIPQKPSEEISCPYCEGTGKVPFGKMKWACWRCYGTGKLTRERQAYTIEQMETGRYVGVIRTIEKKKYEKGKGKSPGRPAEHKDQDSTGTSVQDN